MSSQIFWTFSYLVEKLSCHDPVQTVQNQMWRLKSKTDHSMEHRHQNWWTNQRKQKETKKNKAQRGGHSHQSWETRRGHQSWDTGRQSHQSCDANGNTGKQRENSEKSREADTAQIANLFVLAQKPLGPKSVSKFVHLDFGHVTYLQDTYPGIKRPLIALTRRFFWMDRRLELHGIHSTHPCTTPPSKPLATGAHTHTHTKAAPKTPAPHTRQTNHRGAGGWAKKRNNLHQKPGAQLNKSRPTQQSSWNRTSTSNHSVTPNRAVYLQQANLLGRTFLTCIRTLATTGIYDIETNKLFFSKCFTIARMGHYVGLGSYAFRGDSANFRGAPMNVWNFKPDQQF